MVVEEVTGEVDRMEEEEEVEDTNPTTAVEVEGDINPTDSRPRPPTTPATAAAEEGMVIAVVVGERCKVWDVPPPEQEDVKPTTVKTEEPGVPGERKRRSRWGAEKDKVDIAGLPTAIMSTGEAVGEEELEKYARESSLLDPIYFSLLSLCGGVKNGKNER